MSPEDTFPQVFDVLEQQGRAASLADAVIKIMLSQLPADISYQPLEWKDVAVNPDPTQSIDGTHSNNKGMDFMPTISLHSSQKDF